MDHNIFHSKNAAPRKGGILVLCQKLLAFFVLASLVSNAAAGLASGLAGSLAFAAAAVFRALAKVAGAYRLNILHDFILRKDRFVILYHI